MENIGYWCGLKKDVYTPFQRWGVTWYIGIDKTIFAIPYKDWGINEHKFIDEINEKRVFRNIQAFGEIEKNFPITIRFMCKENDTYPFSQKIVIMNDFIPEKYIRYHPTFFVKGTKKGILTSSHPFKTHIDIPFENELDYEIAMKYKLWYPEIKFYFYPYEKGIHFNRLPKFFPLPIYQTKKNLSDFSPTHLAPKEIVFYGASNQIDLLKIYNCFEFPFYREFQTYIYKVLPEFHIWHKDEFYNNLESVEKEYEENMKDHSNFYNQGDADDWMDDPENYWNVD
jgi:hypothetical protein